MKQLIWILMIAGIVSSHSGQSGYVITGEIKNADGQKVVLRMYRNLKSENVDSTTVANGRFTLKGNVPYPEFCMLHVGNKGPVRFFVENSNIRIIIDPENIEKSDITGSKENDIYAEFVAKMQQFTQQQKELNSSYVSLKSSSNATPEAERTIVSQMQQLQKEQTDCMIDFVFRHPGKISTAFIVDNMLLMRHLMNTTELEQVAAGFDDTLNTSQWVKMLKDHVAAQKQTDIGQPFPDITLKTPDDRPASLSDYAGKGKYVLLDFWASWCGPCRRANPQVVELYNRYKDKGFEIVGISLDRGKKEWVEAIKNDNLAWPHISDLGYWQSAAAKLYSVNSIPYTVLLDKDGKIIAKGLHVEQLAAKLAELLPD